MQHTISILVENEFGVLARVAGLFSGRGFNIQSLTVAETLDPTLSRMTIVTKGSDETLEQINKQLNKLINIIKVQDVTSENAINRALALIKVNINQKTRPEVIKTVELVKATILEADNKSVTVEVAGAPDQIDSAVNLLKPYGVIDFVQTGQISIQRAK